MKIFLCIIVVLFTVVSCSNTKKEPIEEQASLKIKPEPPKYEPSKYASVDDTIRINDLQIILDSILIRNPEIEENSQAMIMPGADEMLNVYVTIINTGKETKEIPYADQIEETRKKIGDPFSVRIRKSEEENTNFRLGSRMFIDPEKNEFIVSVKANKTLTGYYTMGYKSYPFVAISFWYSTDEVESQTSTMSMLKKVSKSYKVEGKPIFHILLKDTEIKDIGFDITDLVNEGNQQ